MINNKLIKIEQIKDLNAIYFYNLVPETSLENQLLGLKITYDNNQTLDYKYTDEYFEDFVIKVLDTYKEEQSKRNIIILNDFTKEIIEEYSKKSFKVKTNYKNTSKEYINLINNDNFKIKLLEDYFKDIIYSLVSLFQNNDTKIYIKGLKGFRNHYTIEYEINNQINFIPIIITVLDDYNYSFRINNINNIVMSLNGNLKIKDNYIECSFNNKDNTLKGNYFYHNQKEKCENYILYNNKPCYIKKNKNIITNEEESIIISYFNYLNYLNYLNIDTYDNITKITDNDFFISKTIQNKEETHQILCHIRITNDLVRIIKTTKQGIMKYNDQFIITFNEEKEEVIFKLINKENNNYVLVQTKYLPTEKSTGNYKTNLCNKYNYKLFKIQSNTNLNTIFNPISEKTLDNITDFNAVKKLIKERM